MNCFVLWFISWEQILDHSRARKEDAPVSLLLICWCSGQKCGAFSPFLPWHFSHCSICVWGLFGLCMALYTQSVDITPKKREAQREGQRKGEAHKEWVKREAQREGQRKGEAHKEWVKREAQREGVIGETVGFPIGHKSP